MAPARRDEPQKTVELVCLVPKAMLAAIHEHQRRRGFKFRNEAARDLLAAGLEPRAAAEHQRGMEAEGKHRGESRP